MAALRLAAGPVALRVGDPAVGRDRVPGRVARPAELGPDPFRSFEQGENLVPDCMVEVADAIVPVRGQAVVPVGEAERSAGAICLRNS